MNHGVGLTTRFGTTSPSRIGDHLGEWWLPDGATGRLPTVVLVHGGFWKAGYDRHLEDRVAADLAARGRLVWNIDYRPSRAGWPATLLDAASAYDALRTGRASHLVDDADVAVVGHSAGGHLALWLASRSRLPADAPGSAAGGWIAPRLAVGQAPVAALARVPTNGWATAQRSPCAAARHTPSRTVTRSLTRSRWCRRPLPSY